MSVDTTMAVLYAQSGLSTNLANAAMVAPQASMAMSRVLAAEAAMQEREQVEKNEKADKANIEGEAKKKDLFPSRLRARRKKVSPESEPELVSTAYLGNLLNVKV